MRREPVPISSKAKVTRVADRVVLGLPDLSANQSTTSNDRGAETLVTGAEEDRYGNSRRGAVPRIPALDGGIARFYTAVSPARLMAR